MFFHGRKLEEAESILLNDSVSAYIYMSDPTFIFDNVIECYELRRGGGNKGIYIHSITSSDSRNVVLEKRTIDQREVEFCEKILDLDTQPRSVPRVLALAKTDEFYSIFMEYIAGGDHNPKMDSDIAGRIALSLGILDIDMRSVTFRNDAPFPRLYIRAFDELPKILDYFLLGDSKAVFSEIKDQTDLADFVVSHNDIYWPNISFRQSGDVSLLDFGYISPNLRGADLHWYAYYALPQKWDSEGGISRGHKTQAERQREFSLIAQSYSKMFSLPLRAVQRNAILYAVVKAFVRVKKNYVDGEMANDSSLNSVQNKYYVDKISDLLAFFSCLER